MRDLSEFQEQDSGWALKAIVNLGVNVNKYVPQRGSSYIDLHFQIKRKQACINVKNEDEACFAWAVISALFPVEQDAQRVSKYPHYSQVLKLKGIQFPMTMRQIPNFEKQNDISINVYILKTEKKMIQVLPSFLTENKRTTHVNLLLIQNKSETSITSHFVWIKDLSRLLSKQLNSCGYKNYFCDRCLHYFYSEEKLSNHMVDCLQKNKTATKMPEVGQHILKFKDHKYKIKTPFVVYADMESVLKPINDRKNIQEHIPAAIGYFFKCSYDEKLSFY
ncbi:uncharacterized protein LOC126892440 [Diabrotica virgifera virgifera]|uniref:C2H2-type domain-containing protein n=1 Tax=Diabrotica virgifera virgifera TaxID=50390 RepID=A0ABM5L671_DIAVI|nr:uncharacterized protein LOC126892440 [Diabrotica virgifera virgifera]